MGSSIPPKYFMPSVPVGSSPSANSLIPTQPGAQNPQQPQAPQQTQIQQPGQSPLIPQSLNPFRTGGRFFAFLVLLLLPLSAKATTTFTGTIQNLNTSNVTTGTYVRFWLRGCGGNQPRVSGTAVIAPSQGGVYYFDFIANGSGAVSGTLYSTRDSTGLLGGDITCGTSTTSVFYGMQVFVNGKGGPEVPIHAKNGVAFDISTVPLLATTPVPAGPSGGTTTPGGSNGQIQYNNSNVFAGILGSNVTPATGATTLTAGADTTTPLAIASHSNTQSATLLDVNNQSSGTPDTPFVVRGRGFGSFTPAGNKAMYHLIEESDALSHDAFFFSNHTADVAKGSANFAGMAMGVNDSGLGFLAGGGAVGDALNNYWCLSGDANESLFAAVCNPTTGAAIVPFYVKGANSQTADLFEAKDASNNVLAKIDKSGVVDGLLATIVTTGTSANLCTDLAQITFNQEATAGQAVTYTLCAAAAGKRQCVMNSNNGSAANTGILTVAASAAGQFIIFTDGTLTASGGNVTSGGAAGDSACFYGVDSTHWQLTVQQGSWTKH